MLKKYFQLEQCQTSISTGLAFGFISFTIIKLVIGKTKDVKPAMWVIAVLSVMFLTMDKIAEIAKSIF